MFYYYNLYCGVRMFCQLLKYFILTENLIRNIKQSKKSNKMPHSIVVKLFWCKRIVRVYIYIVFNSYFNFTLTIIKSYSK